MAGHIKSIIPQRGGVAPIDSNTVFLAPFNEHTSDVIKGGSSLGSANSLKFDGVDDYVSLGNFGLSSLNNCTVEFWHKTTSSGNWLLLKGETTGRYLMAITNASFYHSTAGTPIIYRDGEVQTTLLRDGEWHHYAAVGVDMSTWPTVSLGNYPSFHLHGSVEGLRIWNTALTQEQIRMIAVGKEDAIPETPRALWKFDEGVGSLAYDSSGNGHDSIINGASWSEGRSIYSISKEERAVVVEEGTTNLCVSPYLLSIADSVNGGTSLKKEDFYVNGMLLRGVTLTQGLTTDIISISVASATPTSQATISLYMRSTVANPLKTQVTCTVSGVKYWLDAGNAWVTSVVEKSNLLTSYTNIGQWQRVVVKMPPFPAGTVEQFVPFAGFYRTTGNMTVSLANLQVEDKSFATSFVDGTRGDSFLQYSNPISQATAFTISGWVKVLNKSAGSGDIILTIEKDTNIENLVIDFNTGMTELRAFTYGTDGIVNLVTTTGVTATEWNHIAVTGSQSSITIYVNGIQKAQVAVAHTYKIVGNLTIGKRKSIPNYGNLVVDELRIDKIVRGIDEIQAWYHQGRNGW